MLKVIKPSDIESVIGTETGVSEWITIDQEQINKFAEATLDNQFIHVDPEAAKPVFCLLYTSDAATKRIV